VLCHCWRIIVAAVAKDTPLVAVPGKATWSLSSGRWRRTGEGSLASPGLAFSVTRPSTAELRSAAGAPFSEACLLQFQPARAITAPVGYGAKNRSGGSFGEGDDREKWASTTRCYRPTAYRDYRDIQTFLFSNPAAVFQTNVIAQPPAYPDRWAKTASSKGLSPAR